MNINKASEIWEVIVNTGNLIKSDISTLPKYDIWRKSYNRRPKRRIKKDKTFAFIAIKLALASFQIATIKQRPTRKDKTLLK